MSRKATKQNGPIDCMVSLFVFLDLFFVGYKSSCFRKFANPFHPFLSLQFCNAITDVLLISLVFLGWNALVALRCLSKIGRK